MPISLRDYQTQYRGRSSSKRYNDALSQIENDLVTCIEELARQNAKFVNLNVATNYQNQAATTKINALADSASGCIDYFSAGGIDKLSVSSMYDRASVIDLDALHNPLYGQVTLPFRHSNSKIPIIQTPGGDFEAIPGVVIELWEGLGGTYETKDRTHPSYKAVDHNFSTFWVSEFVSNPTRIVMRLTYPSAVSPDVNVITVNPFPETVVKVTDVVYNNLTTLRTIPGFAETTDRKIYYFESVEVDDQVLVQIEVDTTMLNINGDSVFPYGLQILDVGFVDLYDTAYAVVQMKSTAPGFSTLTSFDSDFSINTIDAVVPTDHLRFEIYNVDQSDWTAPSASNKVYDSDTEAFPYTTDQPTIDVQSGGSEVENLFVKIILNKVSNTTPVVNGLTITYT